MRKQFLSLICILMLANGLFACTGNVRQHGYMQNTSDVEMIKPGTTTKKQVKKLLGSPTTVSQPDGQNWYYVSKKVAQFAFLSPDRLEDEIIQIQFNAQDVVEAVEKKSFSKEEIAAVPETTPTHGNEMSVIEQLLGNIGRFQAKQRSAQ